MNLLLSVGQYYPHVLPASMLYLQTFTKFLQTCHVLFFDRLPFRSASLLKVRIVVVAKNERIVLSVIFLFPVEVASHLSTYLYVSIECVSLVHFGSNACFLSKFRP